MFVTLFCILEACVSFGLNGEHKGSLDPVSVDISAGWYFTDKSIGSHWTQNFCFISGVQMRADSLYLGTSSVFLLTDLCVKT